MSPLLLLPLLLPPGELLLLSSLAFLSRNLFALLLDPFELGLQGLLGARAGLCVRHCPARFALAAFEIFRVSFHFKIAHRAAELQPVKLLPRKFEQLAVVRLAPKHKPGGAVARLILPFKNTNPEWVLKADRAFAFHVNLAV
jgi:hypothetical protein